MTETTVSQVAVPRLDSQMLKFSQGCVVVLTALAFLLSQPILVLLAALCLTLSALAPQASPFRLLYRQVAVRLHFLQPRIVEDDPAPHRFAQAIGAAFTIVATIFLFLTPAHTVGWTLDLIVFALSSLNFFVGFCAGCFVYYHLGRLGWLPRVRYEGSFHWRGV
jgi:Domain of unknown function (DUF4395)